VIKFFSDTAIGGYAAISRSAGIVDVIAQLAACKYKSSTAANYNPSRPVRI
jgi:hypothetical protein